MICKYAIAALTLVFCISKSYSQSVSQKEPNPTIDKIRAEKDPKKKAAMLYTAAGYYLDKDGGLKNDLDSASLLNSQAIELSKKLNLKKVIAQSMLLDGKIAAEKGNPEVATQLKKEALDYANKNGLKTEAAEVYYSLAMDIANNDSTKKVEYLQKSAALYKQAGSFYDEAETINQLSIIYNSIDEPAISIKYAREAIKIKKAIKRYDLYKEYTMMGLNLRVQGNYKDALAYALAAEKVTENVEVKEDWLSIIYDLVGTIYSELKFYDKSVDYYKKAIEIAKKGNDEAGVNAI